MYRSTNIVPVISMALTVPFGFVYQVLGSTVYANDLETMIIEGIKEKQDWPGHKS